MTSRAAGSFSRWNPALILNAALGEIQLLVRGTDRSGGKGLLYSLPRQRGAFPACCWVIAGPPGQLQDRGREGQAGRCEVLILEKGGVKKKKKKVEKEDFKPSLNPLGVLCPCSEPWGSQLFQV